MREIELTTVEELIQRLNDLPNHFIFRGQANAAWQLQSSLERVVGDEWDAENAKRFEEYSISEFKSKFHLYDQENVKPNTKLAWLAIMQHYGVPTRLVDFTESPYAALYFALETYLPHSATDFAVIAVDYTAIMEQSLAGIKARDGNFKETRQSLRERQDQVFDDIVDRFAYDIAWIAEPQQMNARLDRQAGSFLLSGNRGKRIAEILDSEVYAEVEVTKYRIHHQLYTNVFALLRKMNITSKSLYGDLDGLARSIKMQMQVYSV